MKANYAAVSVFDANVVPISLQGFLGIRELRIAQSQKRFVSPDVFRDGSSRKQSLQRKERTVFVDGNDDATKLLLTIRLANPYCPFMLTLQTKVERRVNSLLFALALGKHPGRFATRLPHRTSTSTFH